MLRITTPKDIIWAEISTNDEVNGIINGINDSLSKNNIFLNNEFSYTVELEEELNQRSLSLLKFAFKEYGWNIIGKKIIKEKNVEYNFKLIVINPIFL